MRDSFLGLLLLVRCATCCLTASLFNRTFGEGDRARRLRSPAVRTDALVAAGLEVERRHVERRCELP